MRTTRLVTALLAAAAVSLAVQTASADAAKLKRGVYDCMAYNYMTGWLDYKGSVKLLAKGRYQHAWGRKKARFEKATKGRYVIRGRKIRFKRGAMAKTPGRIQPRSASSRYPFFNVLVNGEESGISCYFVAKP